MIVRDVRAVSIEFHDADNISLYSTCTTQITMKPSIELIHRQITLVSTNIVNISTNQYKKLVD